MTQRYVLDLTYNGQSFQGFQSQTCGNTVQDVLEHALTLLLRHSVRIRGASRTDQGVHAGQQLATFTTGVPYRRRWILSLNALTPRAIGVRGIHPVDLDFDPIRHSCGKIYRYRVWHGRCVDPFLLPQFWACRDRLDRAKLAEAMEIFVGCHDFRAFCSADSSAKTTVRTVHQVWVDAQPSHSDIWISGSGFLKQMIRIMVGTAMDVARGRLSVQQVRLALETAQPRAVMGATAPAAGLSLMAVCLGWVPRLEEATKTVVQPGFSLQGPVAPRRCLVSRRHAPTSGALITGGVRSDPNRGGRMR